MTYSIPTAVHSTAEAGGQDAIGLQDAEFFTNMRAVDLASGVCSQDVSRDLESGVVFLVCLLEQDNSNIMGLHQVFNDVDFLLW